METVVELKPAEKENEDIKNNFNLNIDNYEGPLDLLLDLAKSQKVDLMKISIVQLADEYLKFIDNIKKNLELAADFLVMAAWLAYLKSRLLLPDDFEDDFSSIQMAEKLKLQLRKLEAIRFLSDKLVLQKQLGRDIFMKGIREGIKTISNSKYSVSLYELIKSYAEIKRKQNFSIINISKLPVYTMEEAIKKITSLLGELTDWRNIEDVVPGSFLGSKNLKKSGLAGTFAGSLELVREGKLSIRQKIIFDKILIKAT
jgi:segregation and condensation protein A